MRRRPFLIALAAAVLAASCAGRFQTNFSDSLDPDVTLGWTVTDVLVTVPDALTVSEANTLAPNADIVWHGEALGDRKLQVAALLDEGITKGASVLNGPRLVRFDVQLVRFHGVTPLAMSIAPSGVHSIAYRTWVMDVATNSTILGPDDIRADLEAHVGAAAIVAAQTGETERARIVDHLAEVTLGWLGLATDPRRSFLGLGR